MAKLLSLQHFKNSLNGAFSQHYIKINYSEILELSCNI
jgi:hypothetical protein